MADDNDAVTAGSTSLSDSSLNDYCCGCCKEASPMQAIVLGARLDVAQAAVWYYAALVKRH